MKRKFIFRVLAIALILTLLPLTIAQSTNIEAIPTPSTVLVNGVNMSFDAYNINGNNYFKLRDLAFILNGTEKQFEVKWDEANNTITLASGKPYTAVGGEMADKGGEKKIPTLTSSRVYLDGVRINLTAYNIEGNNYFKLRDAGEKINFGVDWYGAENTVRIDTSIGYTSAFSPNKPANSSVLSDAVKEAKSKYTEIENFMSALTQDIDPDSFSGYFKSANSSYKSGDYKTAKTRYETILVGYPVHLGARNNYVLTLVHLEEYKAALTESILLGLIHPSYTGNWVNMLIPLYALGYDGGSASGVLEGAGLPESPDYSPEQAGSLWFDEIDDAFLYNYVYAYMESEIGEDKIYKKMEEFEYILWELTDKSPDDTDYSELLAYLEGLQKIRLK